MWMYVCPSNPTTSSVTTSPSGRTVLDWWIDAVSLCASGTSESLCSLSLETHRGHLISQTWPVQTQLGCLCSTCSHWNTQYVRVVWSYFMVLSTMSPKSLLKSTKCYTGNSSNTAEDIETPILDCGCNTVYLYILLMMNYGICSI